MLLRSQLVERAGRSGGRNALDRQRWILVDRNVVRAAGAPWTEHSRAMAAALSAGPDAQLSHHSGAHCWSLPGYRFAPFHLTVSRRNNPVPSCLATVHRYRSLASIPPCRVDGLPVVRPEVLLVQLFGRDHPGRAERAMDNLWSRRLLSGRSIESLLDRIGTRGLAGVRALREALARRPEGYVPPASNLEARVASILKRAGLPAMRVQQDLGDDAHWCGRVDLVDGDLGIVLEVDSERYHTALLDLEADARRQGELEGAGFVVARVTDFQAWHRPSEVVSIVRDLRRRAAEGR